MLSETRKRYLKLKPILFVSFIETQLMAVLLFYTFASICLQKTKMKWNGKQKNKESRRIYSQSYLWMVKVYLKFLFKKRRMPELLHDIWEIENYIIVVPHTERPGVRASRLYKQTRYLREIFYCVNCEPRVFLCFWLHTRIYSSIYCRWYKCWWWWCGRSFLFFFFVSHSTFPTSTRSIKLNFFFEANWYDCKLNV